MAESAVGGERWLIGGGDGGDGQQVMVAVTAGGNNNCRQLQQLTTLVKTAHGGMDRRRCVQHL